MIIALTPVRAGTGKVRLLGVGPGSLNRRRSGCAACEGSVQ